MSKTQFHSQEILNAARGIPTAAWTPRLALYTGDPLAGGSEVAGGSYARQLVTFDPPVGTRMANNNVILFPAPTATWGILTHAALVDAASGGNIRMVYQLGGTDVQRTMAVGSTQMSFGVGTVLYEES